MNSLSLDHIITYTNAHNIDEYLKLWKKQGFYVSPLTVRHAPGKRNGFVYIGSVYLELMWVENEKEFEKGKKYYDYFFRKYCAPYGIAFSSLNIHKVHADLKKRGYRIGPVWSKAPDHALPEEPAWWSFQSLSRYHLPGVWSFILTYHVKKKDKVPRSLRIGKNSISSVSGITFITRYAARRARKWAKFFALSKTVVSRLGEHTFFLEDKKLTWMTPRKFAQKYKINGISRKKKFHYMQEIGLIHVNAHSLSRVEQYMKKAGRKIRLFEEAGQKKLLLLPQPQDGIVFLVTEEKTRVV